MEENCIFCKIIKGEIPAFKVYEDSKYLAFLDISQFTEGHTLVIPKKHTQFIWDVDNIGEYMELVQKVGKHYKNLGYNFVDVMVFGRDVPHAHVHVIPNNDNSVDYYEALSMLGNLQSDLSRRPDKDKGEKLVTKLKL